MPTESAFLLAGLLFIAAALGYVFARYGDTEEDDESPDQLSTDYLKGLNYVLNEESDRAVELFTRMAELDDEALETHFALGALFRKRGEVDRAIRVHQNLMARPSLDQAQKDQAEAALAEDYLSAGLLDRAESLFEKLSATAEFREVALTRLLRIFEVSKEWQRAIETRADLEAVQAGETPQADAPARLAHYYCELAENARAEQDITLARDMLKHAEASRPRTIRSMLLRADVDRDTGKHKSAIKLYRQVVEAAPNLLIDVLPRLAAVYRDLDDPAALSVYLRGLMDSDEQHTAAIAMAGVRSPEIDNPAVLDALQRFIASDLTLSGLVGIERLEAASGEERAQVLGEIRQALRSIVAMKPGYHCTECGYAYLVLQWQCPGCRAWETGQSEARIRLA